MTKAAPASAPATRAVDSGDPGALGETTATATPVPIECLEGWEVLDRIETLLARYIDYPTEHAATAHTLWIAHTYLLDAFDTTPRLAFMSAVPGSGKTRALEVTALLVSRPIHAANSTYASMQMLASQKHRPTLLIDEIDTVYGSRSKGNEELRAFINAGFARGVQSHRVAWNENGGKVVASDPFCAIALAGLETLPATIESRAIRIQMQRSRPTFTPHPLRHKDRQTVGAPERVALAAWTESIADSVADYYPANGDYPAHMRDRARDVWEPLLSIARAAGRHWVGKAWDAARALSRDSESARGSEHLELLADLHAVFTAQGWDKAPTPDIIAALSALPESRWDGLNAPRLTPRRLAALLTPLGIKSASIRWESRVIRGYRYADFTHAWSIYLPTPTNPATPGDTDTVSIWPTPAKPGSARRRTMVDATDVPMFDLDTTEHTDTKDADNTVALAAIV